MEIYSANNCIDLSALSNLDMLRERLQANEFDASCYNGDACNTSSG